MPKKRNNIVRLTLDPDDLPPLSDEEKARLDAIAAMPDENIDYSDAPFRPNAVWKKAVGMQPEKQKITLNIDVDVMEAFKATGKDWQARINAVLREAVGIGQSRSLAP